MKNGKPLGSQQEEKQERQVHQTSTMKTPTIKNQIITEQYALYCGDCVEVMKGLASESIHLSIFSPPFRRSFQLFRQ